MQRTTRRAGPKPTIANPGERRSLGLKVSPDVKNELDAAAKRNGRTQSQEAEVRLEASFRQQGLLGEVLQLSYGPEVAGILLAAMTQFGAAGRDAGAMVRGTGDEWFTHPHAYDLAVLAANLVFEAFRPPGERIWPGPGVGDPVLTPAEAQTKFDAAARNRVRCGVDALLATIKAPDALALTREMQRLTTQMRDLLGPTMVSKISREKRP